jgi:hypothetical protein
MAECTKCGAKLTRKSGWARCLVCDRPHCHGCMPMNLCQECWDTEDGRAVDQVMLAQVENLEFHTESQQEPAKPEPAVCEHVLGRERVGVYYIPTCSRRRCFTTRQDRCPHCGKPVKVKEES